MQQINPNEVAVDPLRSEIEAKMETVFSEYIGGNLLEIFFADVIIPPSAEAETERRQTVVKDLITILRSIPPDRLDATFHYVLRWRSRSQSADTLVKELIAAVQQMQILPLKNICEALLTCQDLRIENSRIWTETFEFLDKSVSKLDYKGVRDVLKLLFDNIGNCPVHFPGDQLPLHEIIEKLILRICERRSNLLPAYFIINEIRKSYSEPKFFPHWRLAECFTDVVESFRDLGQLVTITSRSSMIPVACHSGFYFNSSWKLEPTSLKFTMKGNLPLSVEVSQPQSYLIHQVLLQSSFRDLLIVLLSLPMFSKNPGRCSLEEIFGSTVLEVMAEVERDGRQHRHTWRMLGGVLVFLVLNGLLNFAKLVKHLQMKLLTLAYKKSRDQLMWFLLQCLSAIFKTSFVEDSQILDLYRVLYNGSEEFTVSESDTSCVFKMAATCIWIHILERAKENGSDQSFNRQQVKNADLDVPPSINIQMKFLQESLKNKTQLSLDSYMFATLCNAYSTSKDTFHQELMPVILTFLESPRTNTAPLNTVSLPGGLMADGKCSPLKIEFLDSVTVHVRFNIAHSLLESLIKFLQQKSQLFFSPAVVETYARLLSYMDIESVGLSRFFSRLISDTFKIAQNEKQPMMRGVCEIMFVVCEIISYRLQQVPTAFRAQFVTVLLQAAISPVFYCNPQLYWTIESTLFRQMIWYPTHEVMQPPFLKVLGSHLKENARSFFTESEELSKVTVLAMAKAFVFSGPDGLTDDGYRNFIQQLASHSWPMSTLQLFPPQFAQLYGGPMALHPNAATSLSAKQQLWQNVEQDYTNIWRTANADPIVEHFTRTQAQRNFLCIVWRHILDNNGEISHLAVKILHDNGTKITSNQLANLVDYILLDLSNHNLPQCVESLSKMVWKYAIVPLERLVLTIVLRPYDGNEALYSILLAFFLLQNEEFLTRVQECCSSLPPEHWRCGQDWFEKHSNYHQKCPEKYWSSVLMEYLRQTPTTTSTMPVYFGNACLAILPVFDLLLQRIIEVPETHEKFFRKLLDTSGQLYKFHPQPISFLFNTFRFYEKRLADKVEMKQKLIFHIHNALAGVRGENWLVSSDFLHYLQSTQSGSGIEWLPDLDYFAQVVKRLVDCLAQPLDMPQWVRMDWRFSEFPGPQSFALHAVCVELMALPCAPKDVGTSLLNVVLQTHPVFIRRDVNKWLNALGLIFTSLPISYGEVLYDRLADALNNSEMDYWIKGIFDKLDFEKQWSYIEDTFAVRVLAIAHSIWLQASIGYLSVLPTKLRERLKPLVRSEAQLVYVCQLVCPFLQRLHQERQKMAMDIACDIYEMLFNVDKNTSGDLNWEDTICDLLYHMKYMFIGDSIRAETDRIIPQLRSSLQTKLRYISHQQLDGTSSIPSVQT